MEARILNYRPTWHFKPTSHSNVSHNYYPVTSAIAIRDKSTPNQMTIMTTRTMGGSSLKAGSIELMQSRRLNYADEAKKGVILREEEDV